MSLKKQLQESRELVGLSTVGLTLVFSTFIGLALGYWLDKVLHTRPVLMLVFLVLGIVAGFVNIFRSVRRASGEDREHRGDRDCSPKE